MRGIPTPGVPSGQELAAFVRAGDTVAYLAEQYDCSVDVIYSRIYGVGLSPKTGEAPGVQFDPKPWQDDALCAQADPEAFFPEKGGATREAKRICLSCEVRSECLEYALANQERFGIWGGLSARERRKLSGPVVPRRKAPRTGPCAGCGRTMRSSNTAVADAPGTVQHAAKGVCSTCYGHANKRAS